MSDLTPAQKKVYDFIKSNPRTSYPTLREIAKRFGWKSDNAARSHVAALEKKRLLSRKGGRISLPPDKKKVQSTEAIESDMP